MFSALEQHTDGAWWYHGNTFDTKEEAETFVSKWIWWDQDRPKMIFEHEKALPDSRSLCTRNFIEFSNVGGMVVWNK